jgi:hypothetical protein
MTTDTPWRRAVRLRLHIPLLCWWLAFAPAAHASDSSETAAPYQALPVQTPGAAGVLHVVASAPLDVGNPAITTAVIAIHGHSRDVMRTFQATTAAAGASQMAHTLVVAPVFQVNAARATHCHSPGLPAAQAGDLLWTCSSWQQGAAAQNTPGITPITAFMALDQLVAHVLQQFPAVQTVTIAGFSAGGQLVQRYIGFAAPAPRSVLLRYVVGSPSSRDGPANDWASDPAQTSAFTLALPAAGVGTCPGYNQWKYGTDHWPAHGRSPAQARTAYVAANVTYLLGAQDKGSGKGAAYSVLDTTCAAQLQGPYRLQRGLAYAAYDKARLAGGAHRLMPPAQGCGHDVRCVFTSGSGRAALFPSGN